MESIEITDALSAASAKVPANRVTLSDIEANIAGQYFATGDHLVEGCPVVPGLKVLTVCILVLRNGFTVIGKAAPADTDNFNPELGRKFAKEDAIRQVWPLMGYALRERLCAVS